MKKIIFVSIIIACLFIINSLLHSIFSLWQKQNLILQAQNELKAQQQKNTNLKKQLAQAQSPQFVEEEARNKLLMVKPQEQQVIIPKKLLQIASSSSQKTASPSAVAHWKQWVALFFDDMVK